MTQDGTVSTCGLLVNGWTQAAQTPSGPTHAADQQVVCVCLLCHIYVVKYKHVVIIVRRNMFIYI